MHQHRHHRARRCHPHGGGGINRQDNATTGQGFADNVGGKTRSGAVWFSRANNHRRYPYRASVDKTLAAVILHQLLAERLSDAIQAGLHHAGLRHDGSQQAGSQQAGSQQAGLKVGSELVLYPLPVLGVPGWHEDNQHQAFYDDPQVFRLTKARASGPSSA
ncbi:MAG: DUF3025 domain-containing protein [Betaproteobacteria bacterium]|nr:DUF3025 domain-containing protein [Betaproteobacteria bacterium]